jgi:predicted transcriptional regulator
MNVTAQIVSAYLANHDVAVQQIPDLVRNVHGALASVVQLSFGTTKLQPAVDAEKSVFADHLLCLDCGKSFKALTNHIRAGDQMTPAEYRAKWNLAASYPMVAAEDSARRSKIARASGLGRRVAAPPPPNRPNRPKKRSRKELSWWPLSGVENIPDF